MGESDKTINNRDVRKILSTAALAISVLSVGFVLYCIFVPNNYPPIGEEIAKKFHFILGCGILTLFTILLSLTTGKKLHLKLNPVDWLTLIFALYLLLDTYITQAPATTHISVLILLAVLYFNIRVITAVDARFPKYFILMLLLAGIGQAYLGMKQIYGAEASNHTLFKTTGSFYNPGPYAGFLAVVFSLAFYESVNLYVRITGKLWNVNSVKEWARIFGDIDAVIFSLALLSCIMILIIIPATMSRTAWLAMGICVAAILAVKQDWGPKIRLLLKKKKPLVPIAATAIIILAGAAVFCFYNMKRGSADGRFMMWKISAEVVAHNPAWGTGIGKFGAAYGQEQAAYFDSGKGTESEITVAECPDSAFNDYLQIGATLGIPGLVIFLLLAAGTFYGYARSPYKGLMYALIAMLVFSMASYPLTLIGFQTVFIILVVIGADNPKWKFMTMDIGYKTAAWIGICLLIVCSYCYATINRFENQYKEWKTVRMLYNMNSYEAAARGYADLYPDLYEYSEFLFEYGRSMNQIGSYTASNDLMRQAAVMKGDPMIYNIMGNNYKELGDAAAAERYYQKAHSIMPNRIYPLYLLASLYFDTGQAGKAAETAQRVLDFKEKVTSPATQEIKSKIRQKLENLTSEN